MKTVDECIAQLEEKKLILYWLIDGRNIHCLPISFLSSIDKEWIVENYNVEMSYFEEKLGKYFLKKQPKDIWYGHIVDITDDGISCLLRKDLNEDKILDLGIMNLRQSQKKAVCLGLIIRYDLNNDEFEMRDENYKWF